MADQNTAPEPKDMNRPSRDGRKVTVFNRSTVNVGCISHGKTLLVPAAENGQPGTLVCKRYEADDLIASYSNELSMSAEKIPDSIMVPWSRSERLHKMTRDQLVAVLMLLNRDEIANPAAVSKMDVEVLRAAARALVTGKTDFITLPVPEQGK